MKFDTGDKVLDSALAYAKGKASFICNRLPDHVDRDDIYSVAYEGALDGMKRYDTGCAISTYFHRRVHGAIMDHLREQNFIPRSRMIKINIYQKAKKDLEQRCGRRATHDEVCEVAPLKIKSADQAEFDYVSGMVYLDCDDHGSFYNLLSQEQVMDDDIEISEVRSILVDAINELKPMWQDVIKLIYFEGLTMKETGVELDVTESRVSQIHSKALPKLRMKIRSRIK